MARFAQVIAVDVAHHVTQRGNAWRFILDSDADRERYLNLLWEDVGQRGISLVGYCLMSNHIHLIAIPHQSDDLSLALRHTHGRYASYWNALPIQWECKAGPPIGSAAPVEGPTLHGIKSRTRGSGWGG